MPSERNPFRGIQLASSCGVIFGVISVLIGIAYLIVWLAALGVFGPDVFLYTDGSKVRLSIGESHGGISGSVLVILSACGLWCGLWVRRKCKDEIVQLLIVVDIESMLAREIRLILHKGIRLDTSLIALPYCSVAVNCG